MVVMTRNERKRLLLADVDQNEDKISKLPAELIHQILCFLPTTKCAMSTCILSKRWNYVSKSIPILNFHGWLPPNGSAARKWKRAKQFMKFLDILLSSCDDMPGILKFRLSLDHLLDESKVNIWIGNVMKRQVQELFLSGKSERPYLLSPPLFSSESLTVLELENVRFNVPPSVTYPNLKIVRLSYMDVGRYYTTLCLFSMCPMLEEVRLICCRKNVGVLLIESKALKYLQIENCVFPSSCVRISAPNLLTIIYRNNYLPLGFEITDSFRSLVEAKIDSTSGLMSSYLINLFEKISNARLLTVSVDSLQVPSEADFLLMPVFSNLINLQITLGAFSGGDVLSRRRVFQFLKLTPNLTTIGFSAGTLDAAKEDVDCLTLGSKVKLPHLKSIILEVFDGEPNERNGLRILLSYAGFVATITILDTEVCYNFQQQFRIMESLLLIPSPTRCLVKFPKFTFGQP